MASTITIDHPMPRRLWITLAAAVLALALAVSLIVAAVQGGSHHTKLPAVVPQVAVPIAPSAAEAAASSERCRLRRSC